MDINKYHVKIYQKGYLVISVQHDIEREIFLQIF